MFEVYDSRTNKVLFTHKDESICEGWVYDMNDMRDYNYLLVRKVSEQSDNIFQNNKKQKASTSVFHG